jgi:hypothetical protein
MGRKVVKG